MIKLGNAAALLRIDYAECKEIMGIRDVQFDDEGRQKAISFTNNAWHILTDQLPTRNPNHLLSWQFSNFILAVNERQNAELVGLAMKILGNTKTGPYVGFSGNPQQLPFAIHYLRHCPYWGGDTQRFDRAYIKRLKCLVARLEAAKFDERWPIIVEKFLYAESHGVPSDQLRYLELSVILEMLFLPNKSAELSYRFQLRVAKWFHKHYKYDLSNVSDQAKKIYSNRCKLAHSGKATIGKEDLDELRLLVRNVLIKYIFEDGIFKDKYLDDLCLIG
ncbi:HEPN domain-containing protein [Geobacter sp. OR-1]|uniref:HEPN domain-containing protein n=1 Tax=Geobacter sp. OR-1 TaxID=1266765 RepID=UPI00126A1365|nr:HEPN domain-containing protein [Geobacter sp. OR-1]